MQNNLSKIMTATVLLLASTAMVPSSSASAADLGSLVPPTDIVDVPAIDAQEASMAAIALPCTYNPEAWANVCVTTSSYTWAVNAYRVDTTPDYTPVCPLGSTCVYVPVVLSLLDPATYYVNYVYPYVTYDVNIGNVVDDACDVVGIVCTLLDSIQTTSSAYPHGLEFLGLANDGSIAIFSLPTGELIALPVV